MDSCAVMADYWPAKDLYQPDCFVPPLFPPTNSPVHPTPKPCKPDSICDLLKSRYPPKKNTHTHTFHFTTICHAIAVYCKHFFHILCLGKCLLLMIFCLVYLHSLFEECHQFVSPDNFFKGCVFDSCHVTNPTVECTSLQTYAAACIQFGVCLHWRNHVQMCGKTTLPVSVLYNYLFNNLSNILY